MKAGVLADPAGDEKIIENVENIEVVDVETESKVNNVLDDTDVVMVSVASMNNELMVTNTCEARDVQGVHPSLKNFFDMFVVAGTIAAITTKMLCRSVMNMNIEENDERIVDVCESSRSLQTERSDRSVVGSLQRLRNSLNEHLYEFDSDSSSIIIEICAMIDEAEATNELLEASDPVIENTFAELVDIVVSNPGQIPELIKDKISGIEHALTQDSFDKIGGPGTLRGIWARLEELRRVAGVKRKLTNRDWSSSSSDSNELENSPCPTNDWLPALATTESESSDSDDLQEEMMFVSQVHTDNTSVETASTSQNTSNEVSFLRSQLQSLEVLSSPENNVRVWRGTAPIPAPTHEFVLEDGVLAGQDLESYNAWVLNNELAIEAQGSVYTDDQILN